MKGGTPYSSASSYGSYVNGSGNAQYNRVFEQGGEYGKMQGNAAIGAQGQRAGRRRRRTRRRRGRGGSLVNVISQAAVPLSVLAMQQNYKPGSISRLSNFSRSRPFNKSSRRSRRNSFRA